MSASFRQMPPTRYGPGSEAEARELANWAERYGATCPDVFGAARLDYVDERPYAYASFLGDLDVHRVALDERIRVVGAVVQGEHLAAEGEALRAMIESDPSAQLHLLDVDGEHGRLVAVVETDAEPAVEQAVRARFGEVADLYFKGYGRRDMTLEEWRVEPDGRTITATWTGGWDEREHGLDADERGDEIHLTAWCTTEATRRRADGGRGPRIMWGSTLVGYERTASVVLSAPVGNRRILDDQRDRILDRAPVKRKRGDDPAYDAWRYVDELDWAEIRGSEGPYDNGWVRIQATVGDTARLEAELNARFGGGFEVVYQAPFVPDDGEEW